ncbi:MAG: lipocalin-like domain-containing protein, partial [Pseudomonadota bacterium]
MNAKALLFCLLLPFSAMAQGFAGLGTDAEGFAIPVPGTQFSFPADHGPHPNYRIEWWYLTANLKGDDGRDYGLHERRSVVEGKSVDVRGGGGGGGGGG